MENCSSVREEAATDCQHILDIFNKRSDSNKSNYVFLCAPVSCTSELSP